MSVINPILDTLLGSVGRFLEQLYLQNASWLSIMVLAWMAAVAIGQQTVHSVRVTLRQAIGKDCAQYSLLTPEELLARLQGVYQGACADRRFMPSSRGLWITRCTPEKLRSQVGFTADGLKEMVLSASPSLEPQAGQRLKQRTSKSLRAAHKIGTH